MRPRDWPQPPQRLHAETLDTTTPSSASPSTLFHPLGKIGSQPEPFEHQTRIRRVERVLIFNDAKKRKIIKRSSLPPPSSIIGSKRTPSIIDRENRSKPLSISFQMVGSNYRRIAAVPRSVEFVLLRALIKFRRANNGTGIVLLENRPLSRRVASCR